MAKITVRLPQELHDDLKTLAGRQQRSLNNLLIHLLYEAVEWERPVGEGGEETTAAVSSPLIIYTTSSPAEWAKG